MIRPTVLTLFLLLLTVACAPLIELEDENIALRSSIDSLEIEIAECRGQGELLLDRLSAIEAQNIMLDDRNRELAARLAEAQYASGPESEGHGTTEAPVAIPDRDPAQENRSSPVGVTVPKQYAAGVSAGLEFLREYQSGLSAFNEKRHAEAVRLFTALLAAGERNDMIDNCLYWLGEAELRLGHDAEAIGHFTGAVACQGGDKVDDALLSRASAYRAAGNTAAARADLERLLQDHPRSELAGQARSMQRSMR
ncbi:MAG: tetratricopeptide repeat protein [Bacteroidetes bacterium]|nr:tetratricopeptide repeat protein [Bacteroidota bacterium]